MDRQKASPQNECGDVHQGGPCVMHDGGNTDRRKFVLQCVSAHGAPGVREIGKPLDTEDMYTVV